MSRARVPGTTLVTACPCGKVFMMNRSLRGVVCTLVLAALVIGAMPAVAEPQEASMVSNLWSLIFDWITVDKGPDPDPNGLESGTDAGPAVDPDGQDKGADPDPNG